MTVCGLALACLVVGPASLAAARDLPPATAGEEETQAAAALARLVHSEALNRAIVAYTMDHVVTPAYHADPGLRKLEADHPGIIDAMVAAMRPEFERGRREALPLLWAGTAAVYATGLSASELRQAVAFYASAAGRRLTLVRQAAILRAPPPGGSPAVRAGLPASSTPDDVRAGAEFEATAAGRKLAALQPRIDAVVGAWNAAPTPEVDARVSEAMSRAASRFYDQGIEPVRLTPLPGREQTSRGE